MKPTGFRIQLATLDVDRLRGKCTATLVPLLGKLCTSNDPPSSATRSIIPNRPKELRLSSASSTRKPTPLSSTRSSTELSVELRWMFTVVAEECLAILLKHSC